jgi:hypothetical protein
VNVAVTFRSWLMDTVQVLLVPLHAPDQRVNVEPLEGIAINVTFVCDLNQALHVVPQMIPMGNEMTFPRPVPSLVTLSWWGASTWHPLPDTPVVVTFWRVL